MFLDRYIRSVDDVTKDVGQELKNTARRIYTSGIRIYKFLLIVELILVAIGSIGLIAEDFDEIFTVVLIFAGYVIAALIQYGLILGVIYRITIEMYARGEMVHLLKKCSGDGDAEPIVAEVAPEIKETRYEKKNVVEPALQKVEPQIVVETQEPDEPIQPVECSKAVKLLQRLVGDSK